MTSDDKMIPTRRSSRRDAVTPWVAQAPAPRVTSSSSRIAPARPTRWSRRRGVLGVFAAFAAMGFVVAYVGPTGLAISQASADEQTSLFASSLDDVQTRDVAADAEAAAVVELGRDGYEVYVKPKPVVVVPPAATSTGTGWRPPFVVPDPGSAQALAYVVVQARGWGDDQFACLVALWNKESGWRVNAHNASSGAYGIPQALPGNKMASVGADWETNPSTQIIWGLNYISGRYGTPCGAWDKSQRSGWY